MIAGQHGGQLPLQVMPLLAAEAWGVPPWEVIGEDAPPGRRVQWLMLWLELQTQRSKARK